MKDIIPAKKQSPILGLTGMGGGVGSNLGGSAGSGEYIDDIFSTYLYNGTGGGASPNTDNGIDFAGEGGMVWFKPRTEAYDHWILDTVRTKSKFLVGNTGNPQVTVDANQPSHPKLSSFNNNGFTIQPNINTYINWGADWKMSTWSFRKCKKFFDIVTWTGSGSAQDIAHNLGSVPGFILVKNLTAQQNWFCYHRSMGNTKGMMWDEVDDESTSVGYWNNTSPTSTHFTVGSDNMMNGNGNSYIAYLFGHEEEVFGEDGDQSVISCGQYTGNGNSGDNGPTVNLGWEPQFIIIKAQDWQHSTESGWNVFDCWRGLPTHDGSWGATEKKTLWTNTSGVEQNETGPEVNPTGFRVNSTDYYTNRSGTKYIYIAIRRPDGYVGKPFEASDANKVFGMATGMSAPNYKASHVVGFPVDATFIDNDPNYGAGNWEANRWVRNRLTQNRCTPLNETNAESAGSWGFFDYQDGWLNRQGLSYTNWTSNCFRRHKGFDVVMYRGTGSQQWINHTMNQKPEMMVVKARDWSSGAWTFYHKDLGSGNILRMNTTDPAMSDPVGFGAGDPFTKTQFRVNTDVHTNSSAYDYVAYLWSSIEGISKVGTYTGSNSSQTISLGFQPRMFFCKLITSGTNEYWVHFNSERGWNKLLMMNNANAQSTNAWVTPTASGITLVGDILSLSRENYTYVYYAHA